MRLLGVRNGIFLSPDVFFFVELASTYHTFEDDSGETDSERFDIHPCPGLGISAEHMMLIEGPYVRGGIYNNATCAKHIHEAEFGVTTATVPEIYEYLAKSCFVSIRSASESCASLAQPTT